MARKTKAPSLDEQYFADLDNALGGCSIEDGFDLPGFTKDWVSDNEAKCKKEASSLYYLALYKKGRDHIKRPVGEQAYLPGFEYLGDLVPVAISVPTPTGRRFWPLVRATVNHAKAAYEMLVSAMAADAARANSVLVLIRRAEKRGASGGDMLLEARPEPPERPPAPEARPEA